MTNAWTPNTAPAIESPMTGRCGCSLSYHIFSLFGSPNFLPLTPTPLPQGERGAGEWLITNLCLLRLAIHTEGEDLGQLGSGDEGIRAEGAIAVAGHDLGGISQGDVA